MLIEPVLDGSAYLRSLADSSLESLQPGLWRAAGR
jgi:hypothetical protein